jgi:hypothetical protein
LAQPLQWRPSTRFISVTTNVRNQLVNFRILDVFHPDPNQLLREMHGEDLLQGVVVDISRGGSPEKDFVVIQVEGMRAPVIVALNRVLEVT